VSFGYVMDQVFRSAYPTWIVGVNVTYRVGRSADEASLARSRIEEAQARARLQSSELKAVRQLRPVGVAGRHERAPHQHQPGGARLAEKRLEAEQSASRSACSTTFLVVQAQRDLAQAPEQRASGRARVREGRHRIRDAARRRVGGGHHDRGVHGHHDRFREHRERSTAPLRRPRPPWRSDDRWGAGPRPVNHTTTSFLELGGSRPLSVISTPK